MEYVVPSTYVNDKEYTVGCFECGLAVVVRVAASHRNRHIWLASTDDDGEEEVPVNNHAASLGRNIATGKIKDGHNPPSSLSKRRSKDDTASRSKEFSPLTTTQGPDLAKVTFLCTSSQGILRNMLTTEAGRKEIIGRMRQNSGDMILSSTDMD
jgi:hypothetical protein